MTQRLVRDIPVGSWRTVKEDSGYTLLVRFQGIWLGFDAGPEEPKPERIKLVLEYQAKEA